MDIPASRCLGLPRHTAFKPPTRKKLRISSLTIKDGSVVLRQKVLVREEIEMVHQGAGHEERQHALERGKKKGKKAFFELPKSTPQAEQLLPGSQRFNLPQRHRRSASHLLQQTHHVGVGVQVQGQGPRESFLVLKAAGVELGPKLHLQLPKLLRRALVFGHAALELAGPKRDF